MKKFHRRKEKRSKTTADNKAVVTTKQYTATPEELSEKRFDEYKDDITNENQLPLIAEEIKRRANRIKEDIYKIGELLTTAKNMLPHGEFAPWIKKNFSFSYNTANNFMHVFICCAGNQEAVSKIKPSVLYKIASKYFPEQLRKFILNNADILEEIDNETIADIGRRFAEGELDLDSDEVKALVSYKNDQNKSEYIKFQIKKYIDSVSKVQSNLVNSIEKINNPFLDDDDVVLTKKQKRIVNDLLEKMKETIESLTPA